MISLDNRKRYCRSGIAQIEIITALFLLALAFSFFTLQLPSNIFLVLIAGCLIFTLSFINTDFVLVILILATLLSPEIAIGGVKGREIVIRAEDIFLIFVFLGWLAKIAVNKQMGLLKFTPLNKPIAVYVVVSLIATFLGIIEGFVNYRTAFFYLLKYIEYYLLFFMVVNHIKTRKQVKFFVFFMLITCIFVCLYAARQIPTGERLSAPFEGKGGEPNTFAGYLLLMMSVVGGLLLYPETKRQRLLFLGLLGFVVVVFLLTLSRGGWLGFFPMYAMFIILSKRFRIPLFAVFLVILVSMPFVMPQKVKDRFTDVFAPEATYVLFDQKMTFSKSTAARINAWRSGVERWKARPLLGFGVSAGGVTDNQYTRVLTETGTIGFIVFVWLLVRLFRVGFYSFRNSGGDNFAKGLSLGFLAGLVGLLTHSLSAATFILIRIMEPFWFLAALVVMLPIVLQSSEAGQHGGLNAV